MVRSKRAEERVQVFGKAHQKSRRVGRISPFIAGTDPVSCAFHGELESKKRLTGKEA
jgi:hypothetical protein